MCPGRTLTHVSYLAGSRRQSFQHRHGTGWAGMADGSHKMSRGEFEVALGALGDATRKVRSVSRDIQGDLGQIRTQFARLPGVWRSPSQSSSEPVMKWFDRASADLHALLEEMTRRMQVSYDTYVDAEK